jgi:predicted nucleotidyltransferase
VETIQRLALADQFALDGSYLTSKADPSDIDLAVLTPGMYQLAGEQRFAAEGIDIQLLDIQFAHNLLDFQGWLAFFSTARDGISKGVVIITF